MCRRLSGNGKSVYLALARAGGGAVRVRATPQFNTSQRLLVPIVQKTYQISSCHLAVFLPLLADDIGCKSVRESNGFLSRTCHPLEAVGSWGGSIDCALALANSFRQHGSSVTGVGAASRDQVISWLTVIQRCFMGWRSIYSDAFIVHPFVHLPSVFVFSHISGSRVALSTPLL